MSIVNSVVALLAAAGGLGGFATLVTAVSDRKKQTDPGEAKPAQIPSDTPASLKWCLALTIATCLLAAALVITVGATEIALDKVPLAPLLWAVVASAALAMPAATSTLRQGLREKRPDMILYAATGFMAAFGALATTVIAGTS
jgi:hypothetical protein